MNKQKIRSSYYFHYYNCCTFSFKFS